MWAAYQLTTSEPYYFHITGSLISFHDFCDMDIRWFAVTDEQDAVVGVAGFGYVDPINRSAGIGLAILPEHRKGGLGRAALAAIEELGFSQMGCHKLWASVVEDNLHVWQGMKQQGWKVSGRLIDAQFMNGKWHNRVLLEKIHG
jgi:RimJ/RimL family protein N-acetyltransferase